MRAIVLSVALVVFASPVWPNARVTVLMDVLQVDDVVRILRSEGLTQADVLNEDMLDGRGGAFWDSQIRQIYDVEKMTEQIRQSLEVGLNAEQVDLSIAFFGSVQGSRIIALENAARRAMADPQVEQAARDTSLALLRSEDATAALVQRFIEVNDLYDRNLAGAMSAHVQFYKGLSDGGYLVQSDAEILTEVWAQEEGIRNETTGWLNAFLLLAYRPLSADVLEAHVAFADSDAGQALNAALFDGFESLSVDISYALGRAVALNAEGDEI